MKKRAISFALALAMLVTMLPVLATNAQAAGEDATALLRPVSQRTSVPSGYTPIYDAQGLRSIEDDLSGKYILMNDIDLSGLNWTPLHKNSEAFTGTLEGNGYTIRSLTVNAEQYDNAALFRTNEGTIQNLRITGQIDITSDSGIVRLAAALALYNKGTIYNCTSGVSITAGGSMPVYVGGLAVYNYDTIDYCRYTGTIRASAGGGEISVGGIANQNESNSKIAHGENVGTILAVSGNSLEVDDTISSLANESRIDLGGIVAKMSYQSSLDQCRVAGPIQITGESYYEYWYIGGLVGFTSAGTETITDCCFNGDLSINVDIERPSAGIYKVGGLVGDGCYDEVSTSYVSGTIVDKSPNLGGTPGWLISDAFHTQLSGCYYPAGTFEAGSMNQPEGESTPVSLAAMKSKATFPDFDFTNVWTINQSCPVQKVFTTLYYAGGGQEEVTPDPDGDVAEMDDQEYINQHVLFAQTGEYSVRMDSRFARSLQNALDSDAADAAEAAYNILNTVSELSRFKTLSVFDNPYDAILTELILSSANANVDSMGVRAEAELLGLANNIWGMVQKVRPDYQPGTYKPAIQSLLTAPESLEKSNPGLYTDLVQALEDYMDTEGAYKAAQAISGSMNFFGKANEVVSWLGKYQDAMDWIVDCANFTSIVRAYQSLSDDYVVALRQVASEMNRSGDRSYALSFSSALDTYDNWLTEECIAAAAVEQGVKSFGELTVNILSPLTQEIMISYLSDALGIGAGKITAVVAAYNLGWSLSDTLTGNSKVVESRELIRSNYYLESALYQIQQRDRAALLSSKTMDAAKKFDASYMLLRTCEMYSLQAYKDYLEAQQESFTQGVLHLGDNGFNNDEITIANYEIIQWDAALCHGQEIHNKLTSQLTVDGNVNVQVSSSSGKLLLTIQNGIVNTYAGGISAGEMEGSNVITFRGGERYTVKVTAAGSDDSDVYLTFVSFDEDCAPTYRAYYDCLEMRPGATAEVKVSQSGDDQAQCTVRSGGSTIEPYYEDDGWDEEIWDELPFVDVSEDDWYYSAVDYVYFNGIMNGVDEDHFVPNGTMSRAMLATVLYRMEGEPAVSYSTHNNSYIGGFKDVRPNMWYSDAVMWANQEGIVTGYSAAKFGTNDPVTRQQMATMLYRYAATVDRDTPIYETLSGFTDRSKVAGWALPAMRWAVGEGIINGVSASVLNPEGTATRAQCAAILTRFLEG